MHDLRSHVSCGGLSSPLLSIISNLSCPRWHQAQCSTLPSHHSFLLSLNFTSLLLLLVSCPFLLFPCPLFALLHLVPGGPHDKHPLPPLQSQWPLLIIWSPPPEVLETEGGRTTLLRAEIHAWLVSAKFHQRSRGKQSELSAPSQEAKLNLTKINVATVLL